MPLAGLWNDERKLQCALGTTSVRTVKHMIWQLAHAPRQTLCYPGCQLAVKQAHHGALGAYKYTVNAPQHGGPHVSPRSCMRHRPHNHVSLWRGHTLPPASPGTTNASCASVSSRLVGTTGTGSPVWGARGAWVCVWGGGCAWLAARVACADTTHEGSTHTCAPAMSPVAPVPSVGPALRSATSSLRGTSGWGGVVWCGVTRF
jgi:hypothetical protein